LVCEIHLTVTHFKMKNIFSFVALESK